MALNGTPRYSGFDELIERHQKLIKGLCWWYADGDSNRMHDLIQDVMMQLWHYRHTLRPEATAAQERQWVRLHCRSVFQHQRRKPKVETVPMEEGHEAIADSGNSRELIDRLAVDLNATEQQVLDLMLDGYTNGEMAQLLHTGEHEIVLLRTSLIVKMKNKANGI